MMRPNVRDITVMVTWTSKNDTLPVKIVATYTVRQGTQEEAKQVVGDMAHNVLKDETREKMEEPTLSVSPRPITRSFE